jgi:glucose-1-phosphate adenylyltransferase
MSPAEALMSSTNDILAVIMGGGRGARLYPLTKMRSKPAVPIAGQYRLIDIPISNCINSEIYRVAILTQFNSVSLHRHITQTYNFDAFHPGWVQIWAAEQTLTSATWYQGTADAVRKQLFEIQSTGAEHVMILAGDHLYRMNYSKMAEFHWEKDADITVAVHPVPREEVPRLGILKCETDSRISDFVEKPQDRGTQDRFISRDDADRPFLASMGIYLFRTNVLIDILTYHPSYDDFGINIIPEAVHSHQVYGYSFDDYWRDIGTVRAFYEINLEMASADPPFNFSDPKFPIYTHARYLPGSVINGSRLDNVLLCNGSRVLNAEINHSVVGIRSQVAAGARIKDTVIMGADYYDPGKRPSSIPTGVGPNCDIEGAIIDKNVRIAEGVVIRPFPRGTDLDRENWFVRDGIVVLPKNVEIPAGTRIAPEG